MNRLSSSALSVQSELNNLPFDEWTETFESKRLTGALLDRMPHHVSNLENNGDSYRRM